MNSPIRVLLAACLAATPALSHAEVIERPDIIGLVSGFDAEAAETIFGQDTHPEYFPIDDSFAGTVIFTFTIRPRAPGDRLHQHYLYFLLRNADAEEGQSIPLRIGNEWDNINWSARNPEFEYLPLLDAEGNTVNLAIGQTREFVLTIDYRAGADDAARVLIAGRENILPERDYSFTTADAQGGFGSGGEIVADFIDITVEIIPEGDPGPPVAPTGLSATAGDGEVVLGWNAVAGADSYNVKRGLAGGALQTVANTPTPGYVDTDVTNGVAYDYAVTAFSDEHGEGELSAVVSATPEATADRWAGYEIDSNGWVNTGEWMGMLNVIHAPWIYSQLRQDWLFIEESFVSEDGTWIFIPRY